MTRGVCGIWYCREDSIAMRQHVGKYGRAGARMTPDASERAFATNTAISTSRLDTSGVSGKAR